MKVLHITAQKPNSTGSGIYMSAVVKGFKDLGYQQAIIAGIDKDDVKTLPIEGIKFYPVQYNTKQLPFNVLGMSDTMPYASTRYKDMDNEMVIRFKEIFKENIEKVIDEFKPNKIICHHLYLLTALVRETVKDIPVVAICHGTCIRQLGSHDLEKEYILKNIKKLDMIFALHEEQRKQIISIFDVNEGKVKVLGSGYDQNIFFENKKDQVNNKKLNITYAGKIAEAKGVKSLIKSLEQLNHYKDILNINIIGDGHDQYEYDEIVNLVKYSNHNINFLGKIEQTKLASVFRETHLFILPSFYEGLPLVVIEALASGCSVVTTDIPGVKEWIGDKINNSGKINYVSLPKMKAIGVVKNKEELDNFESNLANSIENMIIKIKDKSIMNKSIKIQDKTWSGLCIRLESMI